MEIIEKLAETTGRAVGTFERARLAARVGRQRPAMFSSIAKQADYQSGWSWAGGDVKRNQQERAIQNSWVFSAIDTIASEASAAQFQVVEHHGIDNEPTQIVNHPLEQLLRRPNPHMGQAFLWRYSWWWLKLDGNFYWFLWLGPDGRPKEIWPLPAFAVRPRGGDGDRIIDHYEYNVNGRIWEIPAELVVHVRQPNPFDIFNGMSELVAAMLPTDADIAMQRWNAAFFGKNNVMPSAIINLSSGSADQPINPADGQRLKADLEDDYGAFERKALVTTANSITATLLGWNAKDMDFLAGRQFSKEEIWSIFKMSAGLYDPNATEANAESARRTLLESAVWPMLVLTAEQLTAELVEPFYGPRRLVEPSDQLAARVLSIVTGRQVEPPSRLVQLEAQFEDIRPVNRELELRERESARGVLTIDEVRQDYFQKEKLGDERGDLLETEVGGAQDIPLDAFELEPGVFGTSLENPDAIMSAIRADLKKWQKKATRALKAGKSAAVDFESKVIPAEIGGELILSLGQARSVADIKAAFSEVSADVPFWVTTTATV